MTTKASLFDRRHFTEAEIEAEKLERNLSKPAAMRVDFLLQLVGLSGLFQKNAPETNMDQLKKELLELFRLLHSHDVAYLVVGGFAVNAAGFSRYTGDLDLWLHDTPDNRKKLVSACREFGVPGAEHLAEMDWVAGWSGFRLENGFEVEIMASIAGFLKSDHPSCLARAEVFKYGKIPVPTLHLNDLLLAKKALARPKDKEDIRQLERIKQMKKDS